MSKPYPAYKDSEIEWVGSMPEHWSVRPLFAIFKERDVVNVGNQEDNVLSLSYGQIIRRDVESNFGLLPESFETYNIVEPLNIVLRLTDLQNDKRSLRCGLAKERGIITSAYVTLENKGSVDCEYMFFLLHNYDIWKVFYGMGGGVRQSIKFGDLKRLPMLEPPKEEQQAIKEFLNKKVGLIRELIAKKERMIELLKEERTVVTNQAMTKGLDANVEMKNSGIDWLGRMPKHWQIDKIRYAFTIASGNGFSDELQGRTSGDYPFYKVSDINSSEIFIEEANNYVSLVDVQSNRWNVVPKGSIVLAKIGAALAKNHRKITNMDCLIDNNMMAVTPKDERSCLKYYYYLMRVIRMEWFSNPGAVPSVDVQRFRAFFIPKVQPAEQEAIAAFLDKKITQIDSQVALEVRSIELLKEYRTSLISEVVTGKLDIRRKL